MICSYLPQSELNSPALISAFCKFSMLSTWVTWLTSGGNWQLRGTESMRPAPLRDISILKWEQSLIYPDHKYINITSFNIGNNLINTKIQNGKLSLLAGSVIVHWVATTECSCCHCWAISELNQIHRWAVSQLPQKTANCFSLLKYTQAHTHNFFNSHYSQLLLKVKTIDLLQC